MPKVGSKELDDLLRDIKNDIIEDNTQNVDRSYQVLADGTLVVHLWSAHMINPIKTYRINMSIGREMSTAEWKGGVFNAGTQGN